MTRPLRIFGNGPAAGFVAMLLSAPLLALPGAEAVSPDDPRPVLLSLAVKAMGEEGAAAVVDRLLAAGPAAMDGTFREEVAAASPTEAARVFGLTLLRTGEAEFRARGLALLEKAAEGDSVLAMEALAEIRLEGAFGMEPSVDEAVALLKKARQLPGATESHRMLGDLALEGKGLPRDPVIAIEYYRRGAEAGAVSCHLALHRLFRVRGSDFWDPVEAERYGRIAAEAGSVDAMMEMAVFFEAHSEGAPEWLRSGEWLRLAVERGSAAAALRLADYHLEGRLGAASGEEAMRLLRLAAAAGSGAACFRIGEAYRSGDLLPQDPVAATAWHRIGADIGFGAAENAYGMALATGYGTRADPGGAVSWFQRAAAKGVPEASINLGELYEHGVGVERSREEAARFYRSAAEAGAAIAQQKLAELLSSDGGGDEAVEASYWSARAVASGRAEAAPLADRLRSRLTPEQLELLERRLSALGDASSTDD